MTSGPITLWQIHRDTMETVTDFILGGSTITADGDCSHEIKRHWLLGRKAMTKLDSVLKSRDITLPTKFKNKKNCKKIKLKKNVCLVKAMTFSIVIYGCVRLGL